MKKKIILTTVITSFLTIVGVVMPQFDSFAADTPTPVTKSTVVGWQKEGTVWYYYKNGNVVRNAWIGNYWLGADGKMAISSWVDSNKYYVNSNGKWIPNAHKDINKIYSEVRKETTGNVLVGIKGEFLTPDKDAILRKINHIRKEAFEEGMPDADRYIPVKWSNDLEKTALVRAVESSITMGHKRLTNKKIWSAFPGVLAEAENLAWSYEGFDNAINQWYKEKEDYIKQEKGIPTSGRTGHYRWLITPIMQYIGIASFKNPNLQWITTALSLGGEGSSENLIGTYGKSILYTEVDKTKLSEYRKLADIE